MRVLLLTPNFYPKVGGIESHVIEILRNVGGIDFTVLTTARAGSDNRKERFPRTKFVDVWPADREIRKWFAPLPPRLRARQTTVAVLELLRHLNRTGWLRRLRPDLIHIHYLELDQVDRAALQLGLPGAARRVYSRFVSKAEGIAPVLFTDHTVFSAPDEMVPAPTKETLLGVMKNIVSVDKGSFEVVRRHHETFGGRAWYIPNSVDTYAFRPEGRHHPTFSVGYAARVGKAGGSLIRSVRRLLGDHVQWHVAVGGEAYDLAREETQAAIPKGRFHQNLDYFGMPAFYNELDLFVNPYPGEGVGRTTLEAMACGVPVVAVGMTEKYPVQPGKTGYVVPPTPEDIADAIRIVASDPSLARRMAGEARTVIEREFANDVLLPKLQEIYTTLG